MLNKVALFLMNQKGLSVLQYLLANNYGNNVVYVVIGRDAKVVNDFSQEIEEEKLEFPLGEEIKFKISYGWFALGEASMRIGESTIDRRASCRERV